MAYFLHFDEARATFVRASENGGLGEGGGVNSTFGRAYIRSMAVC